MLEVNGLNAYYGKSHILRGVNLKIEKGEIVSLLGRNGVGRSTTCKAIMGEVEPKGSIKFNGNDPEATDEQTSTIFQVGEKEYVLDQSAFLDIEERTFYLTDGGMTVNPWGGDRDRYVPEKLGSWQDYYNEGPITIEAVEGNDGISLSFGYSSYHYLYRDNEGKEGPLSNGYGGYGAMPNGMTVNLTEGNDYIIGLAVINEDSIDFDFIIIHETAHEWWGNSITTNDIADMWVHEGFGTYSEALYVECIYGYESMLNYINNQKKNVRNDKPIVGPYNVNKKGSNDMYFKGSLMLHTLRNIIDNDNLWYDILYGISNEFKYQTIDGQDIINYINNLSGQDFAVFFDQYLNHFSLPIFEYKLEKSGKNISLLYKWDAIQNFNMPILVNNGSSDFWLYPNSEWQEQDLGGFDINEFKVRKDLFFVDVKKH